MTPRTLVVLGGALAGPTAAARARELDDAARIILLERHSRVSYAQCGLAYHLSGEVPSLEALDRERADYFASRYRIEVRTETAATRLDPVARQLALTSPAGAELLSYDALIVALGAESRKLPEVMGANVRVLRTLDDLAALDALLKLGKRRIAVLGGGLIGLEAADGLIRGGAEVTLVEAESHLLPRFGRQVQAMARHALQGKVRVILHDRVARAEGDGSQVERLVLRSGEVLAVDAVVVAVGLTPRSQLLADAGARLAEDGTILVGKDARTSLADVWACGVCVSVPQVYTGKPIWLPQGAIADKTAQVAGENAAGGEAQLMPALGSQILRLLDSVVGRTGLTEAEAQEHFGSDRIKRSTVHAPSHEPYFPGSELMLVEMIWERDSGRILGVEAIGKRGVDKRIDAAAAAIAGGMTVDQLANLDFAYAPPFGAARDPLNVVATVAAAECRGLGVSLTPSQLVAELETVQVIDVRTQTGWPESIAASKRIPLTGLRERVGELDAQRPLVAVSGHGKEGWLACRILSQKGFRHVAHLSGGLASWTLEVDEP